VGLVLHGSAEPDLEAGLSGEAASADNDKLHLALSFLSSATPNDQVAVRALCGHHRAIGDAFESAKTPV
jgi:hypothetical protein